MASERIHIVCFGNELHGDDGLGPAVHALLSQAPLPEGVRLMRADVAGLSAIACFENCDRVIIVDALRGHGPAGTLHQLDALPLAEAAARDEAPAGFHGAGVGALLSLLPVTLDALPRMVLLGVEILAIRPFRPGLSAPVEARVGETARRVLSLLS